MNNKIQQHYFPDYETGYEFGECIRAIDSVTTITKPVYDMRKNMWVVYVM